MRRLFHQHENLSVHRSFRHHWQNLHAHFNGYLAMHQLSLQLNYSACCSNCYITTDITFVHASFHSGRSNLRILFMSMSIGAPEIHRAKKNYFIVLHVRTFIVVVSDCMNLHFSSSF